MRRRSASLALVLALFATAIATPVAAETIQQERGRLLAPTPLFAFGTADEVDEPLPYDGISYDEIQLVPEATNATFVLEAVDGIAAGSEHGDLDVCFYDESDQIVGCAAGPGDETGTVPAEAVVAGVFLHSGVDVTYELTITG